MALKMDIKVALPKEVESGLEQFTEQMTMTLKDDLVSIVLYGSIVKGEHQRTSDVNVMVVLKTLSVDILDKIAPLLQVAWQSVRLVAMVLSEEELKSSASVFAIKFIDIQKNHALLAGRDCLKDLVISRDHLRFLCEQSLKNELLRLQQFYLRGHHSPELIENKLIHVISPIVMDLRIMVRLKIGQPPQSTSKEVITKTWIEHFGSEGNIFLEVLKIKRGEKKPARTELKSIYNQFLNAVQHAAKLVERI